MAAIQTAPAGAPLRAVPLALFLAGTGVADAVRAGAPGDGLEEVRIVGLAQRDLGLADEAPTASRLGVGLGQLPASVDRLDAAEILARGRTTVVDAVNGTTGVVAQNRAGAAGVFSWRGFTENAVATLFDGIRIQNSTVTTRNYDAFTFEGIEIARGPASSLFGEGALAGAVNYLRKKPRSDAGLAIETLVQAGSFDTWRIAGGVNAPVGERLTLRVDGVRSEQGSPVRGDQTQTTQLLAGARLDWSEVAHSTLQVDWFDQSRDDAYWGTPVIAGRVPFDLARVNYNNATNNRYADEVLWVTLETAWALPGGLRLQHVAYAYDAERDWRNIGRFLWNASSGTVGRTFWEDLAYDHQLRGTRLFVGAEHGRLNWLVGADGAWTRFASPRQYSAPFGLQQQVDPRNPATVDFFAFGRPRVRGRETDIDQVGVFGEARFQLLPRLALHAALRREDVDAAFARFDVATPVRYDAAYDPVTWNVGAVFAATPELSLYAQVGRSGTPADSLLVLGSAADAALDLTTGRGLEAGLKGRWLDDRLQATLAVFSMDQRDIPSTDPGNPARVLQIGEIESRGVEAAVIANLGQAWTVEANVALTDAEFARFVEFGAVRTGNRPPNVPETVANLFVDYRFAPRWSIGAALRHVGDIAANTGNGVRFGAYTLLDIDLRWRATPQLDLAVIARNAGDEDHAPWATAAGGQNVMANVAQGRTVLATLSYSVRP